MKAKKSREVTEILSTHALSPGTPCCAGCGGLENIKLFCDVLGEKTVVINAAGCMSLLTVYPYTPFRGSWIYTSMASAPAGAQGVRDALDLLIAKGQITPEEDLKVLVLTGDGAAYGMGLSSTSAAIDRRLDFIYLCYDNEGYGNTGYQYSEATPYGARTATSKGPAGYQGYKKDLFSIWAAHHPVYLATIIATEPLDMVQKIEKAKDLKGPKLFIAFSPCPTGWQYDPCQTIEIGQLAVRTGIWPLKEYENGKVVHSKASAGKGKRPLVEEYLRKQGRFAHLFNPVRNEEVLQHIQADVDNYWDSFRVEIRSKP